MAINKAVLFAGAASFTLGAAATFVYIMGLPELHGHDPKGDRNLNTNFQYYKVLYLKFEKSDAGPNLTVRHASFDVKATPDDVSGATKVLRNNGANPGDPEPLGNYISTNFDNFIFRSPHRVYIVLDNQNVGFQRETPISFTPYGANEAVANPNHSPKPHSRDQNKSFYNLVPYALNVDGVAIDAIAFENHFRDRGGNTITPNPLGNPVRVSHYSMNINLNVCRNGAPSCNLNDPLQVIPMVIDPDTGNGLGAPPPY